jgi:hypothetical protein
VEAVSFRGRTRAHPGYRLTMSDSAPRRIGPWDLGDKLGAGGNATVWRATRENGAFVALKVVNSTKVHREPYMRFVHEIAVLRTIGDEPGVLPLLDAHLPEQPSADDRPWLAMPIAVSIREALAARPVEEVVTAIGAIAATLARLRAEHEIGHRDVKPANLYEYQGRFLVGDFGLVAAPDLDELTREGRPLGPAHYTAYEMILDPVRADPGPADVYSLGKTLWVLATGQAYPPEGHQPASTRGFSIADLRPHAQAGALDRLVDRCTRLDPQTRPSMEQFADDLGGWAELAAATTTVDFSDLRGPMRERLAGELARRDLRSQHREEAVASAKLLQDLVRPLDAALRELDAHARIAATPDRFGSNMLKSLEVMGGVEVVWSWTRMSELGTGPDYMRYSLRIGRGLELSGGGDLLMHAFVDLGNPEIGGTDFSWQLSPASAPVGSLQSESMLRASVTQLEQQVRAALEIFIQRAPAAEG